VLEELVELAVCEELEDTVKLVELVVCEELDATVDELTEVLWLLTETELLVPVCELESVEE
jgi:hypothetical protein